MRLAPAPHSTMRRRAPGWLLRSCGASCVTVGSPSPPGFAGVHAGQSDRCQPQASPFWASHSPASAWWVERWVGGRSLALPLVTRSREPAGRIPAVPGLLPASRIEDQSLPWGRRISPFTSAAGTRTPHCTTSCLGRDASFPRPSSPAGGARSRFRGNESHVRQPLGELQDRREGEPTRPPGSITFASTYRIGSTPPGQPRGNML